jgi:hypothetical protein
MCGTHIKILIDNCNCNYCRNHLQLIGTGNFNVIPWLQSNYWSFIICLESSFKYQHWQLQHITPSDYNVSYLQHD